MQYLSDVFWGRWKKECLPLLLSRRKWYRPKKNFAVGDTFIVIDESTPRNVWVIGRIKEVFLDKYGLVRRVKVKTNSRNLCLLIQLSNLEQKFHDCSFLRDFWNGVTCLYGEHYQMTLKDYFCVLLL